MSGEHQYCLLCSEEDCTCGQEVWTSPPVPSRSVENEGLRLATYQKLWEMLGVNEVLSPGVGIESNVQVKLLDVFKELCLAV